MADVHRERKCSYTFNRLLQFGLAEAKKKDKAGRKLRKERKNRSKSGSISPITISLANIDCHIRILYYHRVPWYCQGQGCRASKEGQIDEIFVNALFYGLGRQALQHACTLFFLPEC